MKKQRIEYDSHIDALVAVSKRLSVLEERNRRSSEDFYNDFQKGNLNDSEEFIEWSNDYQHYLSLRLDLEKQIKHVS